MFYTINKDALWEKVKEEVSKVADEAYADNGASLYDSIILTSKDRNTINGFVDDAIALFVRREFDVTSQPTVVPAGSPPKLKFNVPDFDTPLASMFDDELTRYIVLSVCAALFQQRRPAVVPEYTNRAKTAMDNAVSLLKSRKHPVIQ